MGFIYGSMSTRLDQIEQLRLLSFAELDFLLTIYRMQSVTSAAKKHNLSASAASRVLKKLRETFRDPLFVRSNPNLLPTPRMNELSEQISEILLKIDGLAELEELNPATLERTFRIAAVDNTVLFVLRDFYAPFYESCPHSVLEFQPIDLELFEKLEDGRIDVALLPDSYSIPQKIREMTLYRVRYSLCVRPGHPLAKYWERNGRLPLDEISKYRKIIIANQLDAAGRVYSFDETTASAGGESYQKVGLCMPYFAPVGAILEKTDLTVLLPDETAQILKEIYHFPLAILPYGDGSEEYSYRTRLIWHERTHYEPVMQWFRGMFALYASRHHGWQESGRDSTDRETNRHKNEVKSYVERITA